MTRTTSAQLDSKVEYLNKWHGTNFSWESHAGCKVLCNGTRDLFRGSAGDLWRVLDVVEHVLYAKETK